MLHLGTTKLFLTSLGFIIRYTHTPSSPLSIALPSTTYLFSLKSQQYYRNWRLQQAPAPRPSHNILKKQRLSTFVAFNLKQSQFKVISCKAIQMPHWIGLYPNNKSYKLHQSHFFRSTVATSNTNLSQKNLVSAPPSAPPILVIERSRPPPAPNINQPFIPTTTFVHKRWKKPPLMISNHRSSHLQLPAFKGNPIMATWQADQACASSAWRRRRSGTLKESTKRSNRS